MEEDVVTYAQNREDLHIASFFPDVERGFYIDVGAHDPVKDSVTKFFSVRGWTGINIEPQREYHMLIEADRTADVNLNIGVSDSTGSLELREFPGGGLSTFSDAMKSEYEQNEHMRSVGHVDYEVKVDTLANVLAEHVPEGQTIHFLKVDVEGLEYEVLRGNDWSRFRPILLCIEAIHIVRDWHQILADAEYDQVLFDGVNEYFLAREHGERSQLHAFAPMFLTNKRIAPYYLSSQVEDLHGQLNVLRSEVAQLNATNAELSARSAELSAANAEHAEVIARMTLENATLHEAGNGRRQPDADQEGIAMSVTHVGAQSFLAQIDDFVHGKAPERSPLAPPPVVSVPLFQGRSFKARIANALAYWPLRIVRRSTTAYWRSHQQVILQLSQEIESLKFRVDELSGEVQVLERRERG